MLVPFTLQRIRVVLEIVGRFVVVLARLLMVAPSHIVGEFYATFRVDVSHETMTLAAVGTNAFVAVSVFLEGKPIFCHDCFGAFAVRADCSICSLQKKWIKKGVRNCKVQ